MAFKRPGVRPSLAPLDKPLVANLAARGFLFIRQNPGALNLEAHRIRNLKPVAIPASKIQLPRHDSAAGSAEIPTRPFKNPCVEG